jgi:hypothetical protein
MGIDVVVAGDADRRARELAGELGAGLLSTPAEVVDLVDRWATAARARDIRSAATEARLLAAALDPGDAHQWVRSLLDQLGAAQADRGASTPEFATAVDPDTARAAANDARDATNALHRAQARLGVRPDADDDSAARSVAAARAVLEGAKVRTPSAGMRLGYVATGNGIALLLVGLEAPALIVVAVLALVVIAGLHQLFIARRTVSEARRPLEAAMHRSRRETAEDLGMALSDLDDWHRRAAAVVAAQDAATAARGRWHALAGDDVEPEQVDDLIAAAMRARRGEPSRRVTWPEQEWAAALARLHLDPCPARAPDRALAQLERRLTEPGARDGAARRLADLLEGRELRDLLADVSACARVPMPSSVPVVLADPLRGLDLGRRNELLRRICECEDLAITLVTADAEAEAWLTGPGRARG